MKLKTIELNKFYAVKGGELTVWAMDDPWDEGHEDWKRPCVIVVPGGGYRFVARREAEPVAADFYARGYQVCLFKYLCRPDGVSYPEELKELASSVDYLKKHADEFHINKDEIFAVGFSAGGHLVGDLCNEYMNMKEIAGKDLDCELKAAGLCYPVIDKEGGSFDNLLFDRDEATKRELKKKLKLNEMVTERTTPAFLWTTAKDTVVPPSNALKYALALSEKNVPFELHVYPECNHGASDGSYEINDRAEDGMAVLSAWTKDCARFFRSFCTEDY